MLVLLALCMAAWYAQGVDVPSGGGFGLRQGAATPDIDFELFGDLVCPDTKAVYPTVLKLLELYPTMRLNFHIFPLPYHHAAYYAGQGLKVAAHISDVTGWKYIDAVLARQEELYNNQLGNASLPDIIEHLADITQELVKKDEMIKGLHNRALSDDPLRQEWKFGCSRGVEGTPVIFVNGVKIPAEATWTIGQWMEVLDPIVQ